MWNLHTAMTSGATRLEFLFGGFITTLNPQYQRRKIFATGIGIFQQKLMISIKILILFLLLLLLLLLYYS